MQSYKVERNPTCTIRLLKPSASLFAVRALQCLKFRFLFHISKAGTFLFADHSTHFGVRLSVCLSSSSSRTCSRAVLRQKKKKWVLDHSSGGERAPQHWQILPLVPFPWFLTWEKMIKLRWICISPTASPAQAWSSALLFCPILTRATVEQLNR